MNNYCQERSYLLIFTVRFYLIEMVAKRTEMILRKKGRGENRKHRKIDSP